jgi:hypothetical protein
MRASSTRSAPALAIDLRPSRRIAALAVLGTALAVAAPWASGMPLPARLALDLAVAACGGFAIRRFLAPAFTRLAFRESGWTLVDREGGEVPAVLRGHARLGPCIALDFVCDRRRRFRAVFAPDNLDADARRRLILVLARAAAADGPAATREPMP